MQADSLPSEPPGKPKNTGVGSLSLLQRIFLTQESNRGLLHCRWILHQLSYQGSLFYLCCAVLSQLCPTLCDSMDCSPPGFSIHGDSQYKNTGVGCQVPLQGIFPSQGLNPGLPLCGWILFQLNHQGSWSILEWVAYPFSRGSSRPRN